MRRLILVVLLLGTIITHSLAQNESIYRFFYIAQSGLSQKSKIINDLIDRHDEAKKENFNYVFYLANVDNPQIVSMKDDYSQFNDFISYIQNSNGYEVRPETDAEMIINYLQKNPYFDNYGNVKSQYDRVEFIYYVNSDFWNTNGNRDLIAALYSALDMANQSDIYISVLMSNRDRDEGNLILDEDYPFSVIAPKKLNESFIGIIRY